MDDLLREFLTETNESLDRVDAELVRFEQEPNNGEILGNIFRLVHTIKGTCGFLSLPRLEMLAHAAEGMMGQFRDGLPVTTEAVSGESLPLVGQGLTDSRIKAAIAFSPSSPHSGAADDAFDQLLAGWYVVDQPHHHAAGPSPGVHLAALHDGRIDAGDLGDDVFELQA